MYTARAALDRAHAILCRFRCLPMLPSSGMFSYSSMPCRMCRDDCRGRGTGSAHAVGGGEEGAAAARRAVAARASISRTISSTSSTQPRPPGSPRDKSPTPWPAAGPSFAAGD